VKEHIENLTASVWPGNLFGRTPILPFGSTLIQCPACGERLKVEKTARKKVVTLHIGAFKARETILECPECKRTYGSEELQKLKPAGGKFGYDVIVYVGRAMFQRFRNEKEIKQELVKKHVQISERGVSCLAKKFIVYLSLAHRESREKLKQLMNSNGGYILHLDATCEGGSPHLMSGLDGITEIVLENVHLSSEKAGKIIPFLRQIKELYGDPLALVHDMARAILNAAREVFPNIPDYICHYHFLADAGEDLFGEENDKIRKRLSKHGIQGQLRKRAREFEKLIEEKPALVDSLVQSLKEKKMQKGMLDLMPAGTAYTVVQWALDGKKQGNGYGFPFDRPYLTFYERLKVAHSMLIQLNSVKLSNDKRDNRPYVKVIRDLYETMEDKVLHITANKMQEKTAVLDKFRDAMRVALADGKYGLNDRGDKEDMRAIEKSVQEFCEWLSADEALSNDEDYKKMISQIKKYWEKLFSDPIIVDTPKGKIAIQPQRTNNILEQLFRQMKRIFRRQSGIKSLGKRMQTILANTPYVKNLDNPEYMKIILDGKETLQERFAEIDIKIVRKQLLELERDSAKIPRPIKKIIKMPDLPEALVALFTG
jgi:hypothetical protein